MGKRDIRLDVLRALAILSIFVAHSSPNEAVFQLRNFDVTMMAFLMGASFYLSTQKHGDIIYFPYVKKRFNRLIVPSWTFTVFFFTLFFIISVLFNEDFYFSMTHIIQSFTLLQGVSYMWIMAVFFIVALLSPLLLRISNAIKSNLLYFGLLIIGYLIYLILLFVNENISNELLQRYFQNYVINGMGYGLVAAVGIRLYKLKKEKLLILSGLFALIFIGLMFYNNFEPTQSFKYPPSIYYFSYGLFVSILLFYLLSIKKVREVFEINQIIWLSKHSLTLYLYHTIPLYILRIFGDRITWIDVNFVTRFSFLVILSILFVLVHNYIKSKMTSSKQIKNI